MGNLEQFDAKIKQELKRKADTIAISPELHGKIHGQLSKPEYGRTFNMKANIWKKVFVFSIVLCIGTATVYAASKVKVDQYISSSSSEYQFVDYPTEEEMNKELDFIPKTIEVFSNGYLFEGATIDTTQALDVSGVEVEKYKELRLEYTLSGDAANLSVDIKKTSNLIEEAIEYDVMLSNNVVNLYYNSQAYKFVPVGYELTPEDQVRYDSGELEISEGASQVEEIVYQSIRWEQDGLSYLILTEDTQLSQESLLQMAMEIME